VRGARRAALRWRVWLRATPDDGERHGGGRVLTGVDGELLRDPLQLVVKECGVGKVPRRLSSRAGEAATLSSNSPMEAALRHRVADSRPQGSEEELLEESCTDKRPWWKKNSRWGANGFPVEVERGRRVR
jgi:hypothetical protein